MMSGKDSPEQEQLAELRRMVVERLDLSDELTDAFLYEQIDATLLAGEGKDYPLSKRLRYRKALYDSFRGMDVLSELMEDPEVTEVMVNGPGQIFFEKHGTLRRYPRQFLDRAKLEDLVQQLVSRVNRRVNEANPLADARLADGSRVNIVLPPVAIDGPVITIRRFAKEPPGMEQLLSWGSLTPEAAAFLQRLVQAGYNIFISGGTGSGKTTFLGALAEWIPPGERVITVEDSAELRLKSVQNLVRLEARAANQEGQYEVTIRDLIRNALRMRPDRIVVGEVRGAEALEMLQAMNTGHDGSLSTGHANSAGDMLGRIETMVLMGMELPLAAIRGQVASAIDILVHLGRLRDGSRRVLSISETDGIGEDGRVRLRELFAFAEEGEVNGRIRGTLTRVDGLKNGGKLQAAGLPVD